MTDVSARVARGAAWLDENFPGWERSVDLAKLDLSNSCRCVLGQVIPALSGLETVETSIAGNPEVVCVLRSGAWEYGYHLAVRGYGRRVPEVPSAMALGFNTLAGDRPQRVEEFKELDEAWISLIKERFDTGALSG